jgi:PelA/Pel-15E family pectate lyase
MAAASCAQSEKKASATISWRRCLSQRPEWYASDEARSVADSVIQYQSPQGGWPKSTDLATPPHSPEDIPSPGRGRANTIDNGATTTPMRFLALMVQATGKDRYREAFARGIDYLLAAQYPNGGWPQYFPLRKGYYSHITYNDGAMVNVLTVLRDSAAGKPPYAFVDETRRRRAEKAVQKGVECILNCQIVADGKKTAWCAQHDEKTFAPRKARSYELPSISGAESAGIVRFLMSIDNPDPEIIEAVQSAVAWFDRVKLTGIRQTNKRDESLEGGYDKVIIEDRAAPPIWARFYQIRTNRPMFCGRDGEVKYRLAEIEHERRTGYAWYGHWPAELLARDYPAWQKKWAPGKNVLNN